MTPAKTPLLSHGKQESLDLNIACVFTYFRTQQILSFFIVAVYRWQIITTLDIYSLKHCCSLDIFCYTFVSSS